MIVIIWRDGDVVFVRKVGWLYAFLRKYFISNKPKIKVRRNWVEPAIYDEYYQEDCTLIYAYEVACIQKYENVLCNISRDVNASKFKTIKLPLIQVGLYNTQIVINKHLTLTIPTYYFHKAIDNNTEKLRQIEDGRKVQDAIKYQKYRGSYFSKRAKDYDITSWSPVYCSICGEPVEFEFLDNKVIIHNHCKCGTLDFPLEDISYDEFALWYTNQVTNHKSVRDYYASIWFEERDKLDK